ncbi:MAG: hypothetical protein C5B54_08510 [Acidobacteria bacterium]|nr:MAG: hypothetical protein C5B54_08510 [Acidobacteriota bacterium]
MRKIVHSAVLAIALLCLPMVVLAQYSSSPDTSASTASTASQNAKLTAKLVDEQSEAKQKMATVQVSVSGVTMSEMHGGDMHHQGAHLHYQVDNGPIVVSPSKTMSFANLSSGSHTITVTVADANHQPISEPQTLNVTIP